MGAGRARSSTIHSSPITDQENFATGKPFTQTCRGDSNFRTVRGSVRDHNFTSLVSRQTSPKPKGPKRRGSEHNQGPTPVPLTAGWHKPQPTHCQGRGPSPSGWSAPVVCTQLETHHKRSLDSQFHIRPQTRTEQHSSSAFTARRYPLRSSQGTDPHKGDTRFGFKESNSQSSRGWPWIHQPDVPSPKVRRILETSYQLEVIKQPCYLPPLQDGVDSDCEGH